MPCLPSCWRGSCICRFAARSLRWLLRNQFVDAAEIQNVDNYNEIKNNVTIYKNLIYPSDDERNTYDIYLPKSADENLQRLYGVHGGAFVAGTKDGIENYAVMLANEGLRRGWRGLPMGTGNSISRQVRQVEECLAALKSVKSTYYLNLDKIILCGDSAGAHIAAQAVLLANEFQNMSRRLECLPQLQQSSYVVRCYTAAHMMSQKC